MREPKGFLRDLSGQDGKGHAAPEEVAGRPLFEVAGSGRSGHEDSCGMTDLMG